jgi:hypothetical protein
MTFIGRTEEQGGDIVLIKRFGSWFPFVILAVHVSKLVLVPSSFVGMAGSNSIKRRVGARQCYLLGVVQWKRCMSNSYYFIYLRENFSQIEGRRLEHLLD